MAILPTSLTQFYNRSSDETFQASNTFQNGDRLSSLPAKLLLKILNDLPDSGKAASQTCKKIHAIFARGKKLAGWIDQFGRSLPPLSPEHFPNICQFTFQNASVFGQNRISQLVRDFRVLKVRFINCPFASDSVLARLSVSTTLRSLTLKNCPQFTDTGLATLLISQSPLPPISPLTSDTQWGLDALKYLHVIDCPAITGFWFMQLPAYLPNVCSLNVSGCSNLTDAALVALFRGAPNLTHFSANSCPLFTGMTFLQEKINAPKVQLKHLHLALCSSMTDMGLQSIAKRGVELTYLNLNQCSRISDAGLLALESSELEICNLRGCIGVSDSGLSAFFRHSSHMRKLNLSECKQLSDPTLDQLLLNCASLTSLGLEDCHRLRSIGRSLRFPYLPQLRALVLSGCFGLNDTGLGKLARNAPQLEMIDISYCTSLEGDLQVNSALSWTWLRAVGVRISGQALAKVLNCTPNLTHLDLSQSIDLIELPLWLLKRPLQNLSELCLGGLHQLKNRNLEWVGHFPQIAVLDLSGCSQLDDKTLRLILHKLTELRELRLQQCDQLTDKCMNFKNRHLKILNLRDNKWLTDAGLQLLPSLSILEILNLQNCTNITKVGLSALQTRFLNARIESAYFAEGPPLSSLGNPFS